MVLSVSDIVGIAVYLLIALFIYKKGWFFSFYSFFKFIIVFVLSLAIGLYVSSHNPLFLPFTALQQSLIIQGILFLILWKIISFKWLFFKSTRGMFGLDHFMFVHHIDNVLNVVPSLVTSFFISFFLFTVLISASTSNPLLAQQIQESRFVKPLSYKIYSATISADGRGLFQGVAYQLAPVFDPQNYNTVIDNPTSVDTFKGLVDEKREEEGLTPVAGMGTFTPPNVHRGQTSPPSPQQSVSAPAPTVFILQMPTSIPVPPAQVVPTSIIPPTPIPPQPTSTPVQIPFVPQPVVNVGLAEQEILRLTNGHRAANGAPPVVLDSAISAVARAHSQDMVNRSFFSHKNPDGLDPFQRMIAGGISFSKGSENIAAGPTADIMIHNWMFGPGEDQPESHRANILNPAFKRIGIGVVQHPKYGLVATQNFAD